MVAVMGITGNVGGHIADTLLQHGNQVRGIVRDPAKAQAWKDKGVELVTADYDSNLTAAFTGVEGVFIMIPPNMMPDPGFPDSVARIAALKNALLAAKPPKVVALSSVGSEKTSGLGLITATHLMEEALEDVELPIAILRPGSFMENIVHAIPAARATGNYFSFYQPLDRQLVHIATQDIGRIAAETLLQTWDGKRVLEISGPESYSANDIASALGQALGKPINAVAVPREAWVDTLANIGIPADRSWASIEMNEGINSRWIDFGVPGTEHVNGTVDLSTAIRKFVSTAH